MNTFNHIFVWYSEHTSTDLLPHTYYRDPYFDFITLADANILLAEHSHNVWDNKSVDARAGYKTKI